MLFPGVCEATRTGTHPAAARPDGKGKRNRGGEEGGGESYDS